MRRLLMLLLLALTLMPEAGPANAQATTDQLNRLSLEALTTPAPGGNPGARGSYRSYSSRSYYRGRARSRSAYHRSYRSRGRSYRHSARPHYHRRGRAAYRHRSHRYSGYHRASHRRT